MSTRRVAARLWALAVMLSIGAFGLGAMAPVHAQEVIKRFESRIEVLTNGELRVQETLRVRAERREIRRGIYRDFPATYGGQFGQRIATSFEIEQVLRNGSPESYRLTQTTDGFRLYIGNPDILLQVGDYTYTITYRTDRQLIFGEEEDRLSWNVAGRGWIFDILNLSATVKLPAGADVRDLVAFTGSLGEQGEDYSARTTNLGQVEFRATAPLAPGEDLTIEVSWPRGFVERPGKRQRLINFLQDNRIGLTGLIGTIAVLAYFLLTWWRVGRDPDTGPVKARYRPPRDLGPGASAFIFAMGFTDKALAATLVSMAVKGYLSIEQREDDVFVFQRTWKEGIRLGPGETAVAHALYKDKPSTIAMVPDQADSFELARKRLKSALKTEYEVDYFRRNTGYLLLGLGFAGLCFLAMALQGPKPVEALFLSIWISGWSFGAYELMVRVRSAWQMSLKSMGLGDIIHALSKSLFALPFVAISLLGAGILGSMLSWIAVPAVLLLVIICLSFVHLLKAPTRLGARVISHLEGYRLYLSVAEKDRMASRYPVDMTPETFEENLPFAIALGVEQEWGERFEARASLASVGQQREVYQPRWYARHGRGAFSTSAFSRAMGSGISGSLGQITAAAAAKSARISSGGSAGAGRGGGGGGGW